MKEMKVRITFIKPVLGTKPSDPEIHSHYVASKAPNAKSMEREIADLGVEAVEERGKTIFLKMEDGTPYLEAYQMRGFFKEACRMLQQVPGTLSSKKNPRGTAYAFSSYKTKIDGLIFVYGPLKYDDEVMPLIMPIDLDLTATDNQRPLRAQTPQGERVALAHSEEVPAGTYFECTIQCLNDEHMKLVREWLDYGRLKGMCQWRNSGKGRFIWEEI